MTYPLEIFDHGSIVVLRGLTPEVVDHLAERMPEDTPRIHDAYAIEPRYVQAIIDDIEENFL